MFRFHREAITFSWKPFNLGAWMQVRRFEDLAVWQKSKELSLAIYRITEGERFRRDYTLRDQIRRAAVSVMSNIAEGFERYSRSEFRHFLAIARGSASEIRSQLHLAYRLAYISETEFKVLYRSCVEVSRMLAALRAKSKSASE
jgi:four helix bundle protein